ncbi:MAG: ABC transporter substrate-binding protein [Candidatus Methylomirabilota bacterium]
MRHLLCCLPLLLGFLLPPSPSHAGERIRVALEESGFALTPLHLAVALGTFEAQGLSVERINTQGRGLAAKALEGGQADFAFVSGDALLTAPPGRPLLVVYSGLSRPIVNWVLRTEAARRRGVDAGSPLRQKLWALRGLTVGVAAPGGLAERLARYVASREGWRIGEEMKLATLGSGPGWLAALREGRADAALSGVPFPELAVARGDAISLINHASGEDPDLADFLMGVLAVRAEQAERQGDLVRRAIRALRQAVRWGREHPPARVAALLQPFLGHADATETLEGVKAVLPALNPHGRVTPRGYAATVRVLEAAGAVSRRLPYEAVVSDEFLRD